MKDWVGLKEREPNVLVLLVVKDTGIYVLKALFKNLGVDLYGGDN